MITTLDNQTTQSECLKHIVVLVTQSCPTLWDPMECSLPGSSVHGILQARILKWVATLFSRVSSQPRDQTQVSCIAGRLSTREVRDNPRQHIKKQRCHFADKGTYTQNYSFFVSQVQLWKLDHTEGWAPKNWCFWTVVLKKTLESLLDCKEIKLVNP